MLNTEEVIKTLRMLRHQKLDVRCVTLGLNLLDCADSDAGRICKKIRAKISKLAGRMVEICNATGEEYGIPIVNKRIAVTPVSHIAAGLGGAGMVRIARALDEIAREIDIDFLGGYSALVQKGMTRNDEELIRSLPEVLASTRRICSSVNVASRKAGINMDAILLMGKTIREIAEATADQGGFGCAKLVIFANIPEDSPFMAGAMMGHGEGESVINIGVSGPGVVKNALINLFEHEPGADLGRVAETIKRTAFRVTRVGELIGREVAERLGVGFGIVDLSLAPTPSVGDSVGEILQVMGVREIGEPGSTAALALLTDAVKKGGLFASSSVGGLSGAFIPVAEDKALNLAVKKGSLTLEKLEAMTSVCSVGLDMIAVPGDTSAETLASLIADEMAIGVVNNKTTAVRVIPVIGKKAGQKVVFGGLFGEGCILKIRNIKNARPFAARGGRIPAPLQSLNN